MPNATDLEATLQGMTPETLNRYKEQLVLTRKSLAPEQLSAVFERIKDIPELSDIVGAFQAVEEPEALKPFEAPPEEIGWWWKALHYAASPFQWLHEEVAVPFAAAVTAPWSPEVAGTEGMGWLERQEAEYEEWESPWGVKFVVETLPWLALPTGASMVGRLGSIAGRLGAVAARGGATGRAAGLGQRAAAAGARAFKPAAFAEKWAAWPVTKPLSMAVKRLAPKATEVGTRLLPDLQPVEEAISVAIQPSKLRGLANVQIAGRKPMAKLSEMIAGKAATADNPAKMSLVANDVMRFEGANKAIAAISTLERLGASKKLFNLGDDMLIQSGPLKGIHIETLRTYPGKYAARLTPEQNAWLKQSSALNKEIGSLLDRYGIERRVLTFEEGGEWAGRRVMGKVDAEGNLAQTAFVGRRAPVRPGMKAPMEKTRVFTNAEDAVAEGYRYFAPEEALYFNIVGAYNRVTNKQWSEWFLRQMPHRTVAVTGQAAASRAEMREIQAALKQINSVALKLKNRETISGRMLKGIKEYYPEEYSQIQLLVKAGRGASQREIDTLLKFVGNQRNFYKREWGETMRYFKEARASAVRPGFTGTMAPDIPAFAGKVFTSPEAKEYINIIRQGLNPQFNTALGAVNQINAVGRYFALAGDVSPFGIQLIFMAGAHPTIYAKAMGGFVRAFFDKQYHTNFFAKHIKTIQNHPNLVLTRGGTTEMTEAMASWGLLRRQPLKIMGKFLEPFMRGYEAALDTAGIYMAEAYAHLGVTVARRADIGAFINEFRGLASTKRIGITGLQRQIESSIVLAPQYNRAVAALMIDIARGGLRGQLARTAVTKGTVAIMAMAVAISYARGDTEEEMREHLNPLSTNFMTWDIAGQRVGPGSKVRSLLFTLGKMIKNPEDTAYHAARFMRGNFAPVLGTSMDLITGKDYIGDPTRDGLMSLTKTVIGENLLPIWVQSTIFEGGNIQGRMTRALAEFGGARGYPMGAYGELRSLQDKLAQERYGMSWEELGRHPEYGKLNQRQLERENPELTELSTLAAEESEKWAHGEQLVWNEYTARVDKISQLVNGEINTAALQFEETGNGTQFRERVNRAFWLKAQMRDELLEEEAFSLVKESYAQPLSPEARARLSPQDLAYREYNETMYAPDMYDEYGEYRFDEADRRREAFIARYGLEIMNYIEAMIGESRVDEPPALQALRRAREVLRPYWDIADRVWVRYPPKLRQLANEISLLERTDLALAKKLLRANPEIIRIRRMIAIQRKQLKLSDPEVAAALALFYN